MRDDPQGVARSLAGAICRDQPCAIVPAPELAVAGEAHDRRRDGRAASADQLAEQPVREGQWNEDAVGRDATPLLGEMPEQGQQPALDLLSSAIAFAVAM